MSGKSLSIEVAWLQLLFNGSALANVWDNAAASPITSLWVSLHTADPGKTSDQTVSEVTYPEYARVSVIRSAAGWTVDAATGIVYPVSTISFPVPSSDSATPITHAGIGRDGSGAGFLFYSGAISPIVYLTAGKAPELLSTSQVSET